MLATIKDKWPIIAIATILFILFFLWFPNQQQTTPNKQTFTAKDITITLHSLKVTDNSTLAIFSLDSPREYEEIRVRSVSYRDARGRWQRAIDTNFGQDWAIIELPEPRWLGSSLEIKFQGILLENVYSQDIYLELAEPYPQATLKAGPAQIKVHEVRVRDRYLDISYTQNRPQDSSLLMLDLFQLQTQLVRLTTEYQEDIVHTRYNLPQPFHPEFRMWLRYRELVHEVSEAQFSIDMDRQNLQDPQTNMDHTISLDQDITLTLNSIKTTAFAKELDFSLEGAKAQDLKLSLDTPYKIHPTQRGFVISTSPLAQTLTIKGIYIPGEKLELTPKDIGSINGFSLTQMGQTLELHLPKGLKLESGSLELKGEGHLEIPTENSITIPSPQNQDWIITIDNYHTLQDLDLKIP